ncbi:MAG: flagellar motor switch protein FliN [Anaerolineae bacterium]
MALDDSRISPDGAQLSDLEITDAELDQFMKTRPASRGSVGNNLATSNDHPQTSAQRARFATLIEEPVASPIPTNIDLLMDVSLRVSVELGRATLSVRDTLNMVPGHVVELDKLAGDPVDVLVNGRLIARGEVVVVDDQFGVRITEIVSPRQRVEAIR